MGRNIKIYISILFVLLALIIYMDLSKPKPIDWSPNYELNKKTPFGLYVFDQEFQNIIDKDSLKKTSKTAYEYLESDYNYDENFYNTKGTVLSITEKSYMDEESAHELMYYAEHGNSVFISSKNFPKILQDSLKFTLNGSLDFKGINVSLENPASDKQQYYLDRDFGTTYFNKIDTLNTTLLGYQNSDTTKNTNFIRISYKSGYFYLHTQPVVFSNYYLLKKNNHQYTEKIISYIPKNNVIWLIKGQEGILKSDSPLRYWLSQPPLRYAWFLFLIGMLVFMIFNAKRKQRIVPIIKPLSNTTVDFTKTIGNLYYQEGDHQNIIDKKIIYFLEKIRHEYLIETTTLDDNFIKKLHLKSGRNIDDIKNVVRLINYQRSSYHQSIEDDLIEINTAIEKILN